MESVTTQLFQRYLELAPGQRLLTLGVAPELAVAWAAHLETWAIWDMLPEVQTAQSLAEQQRLQGWHALHAAELSALAGQRFDLCAVDTDHYPNRAALLRLLWQAANLLAPEGALSVAGPNDGGIQALEKRLRSAWGQVNVMAYKKGHRLLRIPHPPASGVAGATPPLLDEPLTGKQSITLRGQPFTLTLRPGVFAGGGLDPATALLAEVIEVGQAQRVLDLGCGAGILGMLAARLSPSSQITLVDASAAALATAQGNCRRNGLAGLQVLASDGVAAVREQRFDLVLCNPPFHQGHAQTNATALRFIREARDVLAPRGRLYLVANRFLRYEPAMQEAFGAVASLRENTRYKVLLAKRAN
jgi:16S rRNA (guanine1207-N2)-methyltransferase